MAGSVSKIVPSVCPLDCPDACSLRMTVRDGQVVKLEGNPEHPVTRGFACVKMYRYPERQNHPERLRYPQKRLGAKGSGQFVRISWQQALDDIAEGLQRIIADYGAEAILPYNYAGTMGLIERDQPLSFFRAIGASELDQTICSTTGSAAWEANYGAHKLAPDLDDVAHARLIILWGINSLRSNVHLTPALKAARQRGARIIHIDPYRNETSRFADEHWQLEVGSDAALALAMGHVILSEGLADSAYLANYAYGLEDYQQACAAWPAERAAARCGLKAEQIVALAREFAQQQASYIRVGYGMTRNEYGGNALRAITLLPALSGAWQHRGGGAALSTGGGFRLHDHYLGGAHLRQPGRRHINMNRLASALELQENPIQALMVFNANPAVVTPDSGRVRRGLLREDLLTVVLEHFQTDTADYADYLLPATTFLEHPDLYSAYGHYHLQWAEPVVPPLGECQPNTWVFQQLGQRLGVSEPSLYWSSAEVAEQLLASDHPYVQGIDLARLRREGSVRLNLPTPFRPYAQGSHYPDQKIRFSPPPQQGVFEEAPNADYPLRLISPPGSHLLNSSMGNIPALLRAAGGEPQVVIHPDDAERAGIAEQSYARLTSPQGSIVRRCIVSTDARLGTVIALGQWWAKLAPDGKSLNELSSERLTDLGAGSTFGNVIVKLEPSPAPQTKASARLAATLSANASTSLSADD